MHHYTAIIRITLKSILRDRILQGVLLAALLFLLIPAISNLSMRQVTELATTLGLSLSSFLLLLLSLFLGATMIGRDIERKYLMTSLSLPISRKAYFLSRYCGVASFLALIAVPVGGLVLVCVGIAIGEYTPQRPVVWEYIVLALVYDLMKALFLAAFAFFLSSLSTSTFLPLFGTVCMYLFGTASQEAYDYIHSPAAQDFSPFLKQAVGALYYIIPNLSAFDLKVHAIYGIPIQYSGILLSAAYWAIYMLITLTLGAAIFSRREMQ